MSKKQVVEVLLWTALIVACVLAVAVIMRFFDVPQPVISLACVGTGLVINQVHTKWLNKQRRKTGG